MSSLLGNILFNISVIILAIILVVLVGFIAIIITYSKLKSINMKDATKVVVKVLKDIYKGVFDNEVQKLVLKLGTEDGVHYTVELISLAFKDVMQLFKTCIFQGYKEYKHYVLFQFKAKFPPVDMTTRILIKLIASLVEEKVNIVLHNMDIFIETDSFVAVRYHNEILQIAVAKNDDGYEEIESLKAKALEEIESVNDVNEETMTEDWENTK